NFSLAGEPGGCDLFLAKIDPQGTILSAQSGGGSGNDFGVALSVDPDENLYLTGNFDGLLRLGSNVVTGPERNASFVAKLTGYGIRRVRLLSPAVTSNG